MLLNYKLYLFFLKCFLNVGLLYFLQKKRLHTEICCVLLLSTVRLTCLFLEVSEDHPFVIQALINKNRIEVGCTFFSP